MFYSDFSIQSISKDDINYPVGLCDLAQPPKLLYYRGKWTRDTFEKTIAVVGSRQMTQYGRQVLEKFIPDFVAANVTVISGFMYGVDTYAHELTVKYGGKTVAVLGNGLDICYPPENSDLYSEIIEKAGLVISEYPKDTKPQLWTYPRRNRIVAALSTLGVLVVEAGIESGSIITAKWATKLYRQVWAVPGQITSRTSSGTNNLIQNHKAILTVDTSDILGKEYKKVDEKSNQNNDPLEAKIIRILSSEPLTLDELSALTGESVPNLSTKITMMSIARLVEEVDGKIYLI